MPASSGVEIRGLNELNRALRRTSKEVRVGIRKDLREIAEPVRSEAERLALSEVSGIRRASERRETRRSAGQRFGGRKRWEKMRIGLALGSDVIYVAPVQRGVKSRGGSPQKRPNLADLLMGRAMAPALEHQKPFIEAHVGRTLDAIAERWSV